MAVLDASGPRESARRAQADVLLIGVQDVAVLGRGLCGWGYVTIDGLPKETWGQFCDDEKRVIVYERTLPAGDHTFLLELGGGLPAIDGIIVR